MLTLTHMYQMQYHIGNILPHLLYLLFLFLVLIVLYYLHLFLPPSLLCLRLNMCYISIAISSCTFALAKNIIGKKEIPLVAFLTYLDSNSPCTFHCIGPCNEHSHASTLSNYSLSFLYSHYAPINVMPHYPQ